MKLSMIKSLIFFNVLFIVSCIIPAAPDVPGSENTPEIVISVDSTDIVNGGTLSFGSTTSSTALVKTVTIGNNGFGTLIISGQPVISGADSSMFTSSVLSTLTVAALSSTTFTITFLPTGSTASKSAVLTINNSDSDESTYNVNLTGTLTGGSEVITNAEIDVLVNSSSIPSGGSLDFGSTEIGSSSTKTFTISNSGTEALTISGTPAISGTNPSMFVSTAPILSSVAPASSTTFTVTFSPTTPEGSKSSVLIISNSDSDESVYTVNLLGIASVTPSDPEIDIKVNSTSIPSGGTYDFGGLEVGSTTVVTFTILNSGEGTLTITGTPSVSGTDSSMFTVSAPLSSSVDPSGSTTFNVTFVPTGDVGDKVSYITVVNSDSDEGSYIINLTDTSIITASTFSLMVDDGSTSIDNGDSVGLTLSAINDYGYVDTTYTGTALLAVDSDFTISPTSAQISTSGVISDNFTINKSPLFEDMSITVTADNSELDSGEATLDVVAVLEGTTVSDSDFSSGYSIIAGTKNIAPRDVAATAISVNGDIFIGLGTKLIIYPGATLEFTSGHGIIVEGELEIYGTDDRRVKLTASGTVWDGILSGNDNGSSKIVIDGAFIDKTDFPIYIGSNTLESGSATITNSRIVVLDGAYRYPIEVHNPNSGSEYIIENNIIVAENSNAIYFANSSDGALNVSISNNTIIGNGSSTPIAINIVENSASTYVIDNNIISGSFNEGIYFSSGNIIPSVRYNVINVGGRYLSTSNTNLVETGNLFIDSNSYDPANTLLVTWSNTVIFKTFGAGDFNLALTDEFPTLTQASNITSMVGSLTNGHGNEKGAYSNGGYPPNYNE